MVLAFKLTLEFNDLKCFLRYIMPKYMDREDANEEGIFDNKAIELSEKCTGIFSIPLLNIFLSYQLCNISVVIFVPMTFLMEQRN